MQPPQKSWGWVTIAIAILIAISLIRTPIPLPSRGLTLCHSTYLDPIIVVLAASTDSTVGTRWVGGLQQLSPLLGHSH